MNQSRDQTPLLKIIVADEESSDVLETLFTDATWQEVRDVLCGNLSVFDTKDDYDTMRREENDRG